MRYVDSSHDPRTGRVLHGSKGNSYQVTARQTLTSRKPIDQIAVIPCIGKLLVLSSKAQFPISFHPFKRLSSGSTLHFYTLPAMDPVPQALIQSMHRTLAFAVDEQVMRLPLAQGQLAANVEPVGLCVFTRNQIRLYTLRERILLIKVRAQDSHQNCTLLIHLFRIFL